MFAYLLIALKLYRHYKVMMHNYAAHQDEEKVGEKTKEYLYKTYQCDLCGSDPEGQMGNWAYWWPKYLINKRLGSLSES